MEQKIEFIITTEKAGIRLDQAITSIEGIESRNQAQKIIKNNKVTLKGKPVKVSRLTEEGESYEVEIPAKPTGELIPIEGHLNIVFEDEHLLVIDKPAGLVVHPSHGHENDTMVNILLSKTTLAKGSDPARPGIVHRLDKDTSGLMIVAKSDLAYEYFVEEFRAKKIIRLYKAVCLGISKEESFSVSSYLTRQTKDRKKYSSSKTEEGKLAISHFKTLKIIKNKYSLLECELETGRTHQIRVHLKEKHFPILGDETYGHKQTKVRGLTRQALHSYKIGFVHPVTKKEMTFESEMPEDLKFLVD